MGARLCSSLKNNITYFGTDPNYILVDRLKQLGQTYNKVNNTDIKIDIRDTGSEILHEDWIDKVGICFTSPPYFYLEDYKIGEQSYKNGDSYESWINNFLKPTMKNCYKYLINNGYYIININNFKNFTLVEDTYNSALECGFIFIENMELENIKRINSIGNFNDNNEKIMVFKKV